MKSWTNLSLPLFCVVSEKLNPPLFGHSWRRSILFFLTAVALLTSASITGAFAQEKKMKEHTASVSGRVTIDDKPAAGVLVILRKAYSYSSDDPVPSATTDFEGKFTIADVHGGDYSVIPAAPALVLTDGFGVENGYVVIHLGDGEEQEGIRLKLARGGVIAGKVTTAEGWPLTGVEVDARPVRRVLSRPSRRFQTDDLGIYRIYGLSPGSYLVSASAGFAGYPQAFYPGVTQEADAVQVEVNGGGAVANADIVLPPALPTYSVSGIVIDVLTRKPAGGLSVSLESEATRHWKERVDAKGFFQISSLPPGKYSALIDLGDSKEYYSDPVPFEVTDKDITGIEVLARPGARISGQLGFEDASHTGLLGQRGFISLSLMTRPSPVRSPGSSTPGLYSYGPSAEVAPDGRFSVSGYRPGTYYFNISARKQPGVTLAFLRLEKNDVPVPNEISLGPGEEMTGLRIVLSYGTGVVRGKVISEEGSLPQGASLDVTLLPSDDPGRVLSRRSEPAGPDGRYLIDGIISGTYILSARLFLMNSQGRRVPASWISSTEMITVTNDEPLDITITIRPRTNK